MEGAVAKPKTKTVSALTKAAKAKAPKAAKAVKPKVALGLPDAAPVGAPTLYRPEFAKIARAMAKLGGTDFEIAEELGVSTMTLWRWRSKYPDFCYVLNEGKDAFDDRIERSLAQKAAGYSYHSEKIMSFEGTVIRADTVEHVPPDVGAIKMWLGNRRPDKWKDKQEVAVTGAEAFVAAWKAISEKAA
jgi:hypothetical protein